MATANFSDLLKAAEDAGYSLCPVGVHEVKVVSAETKSTAAGKDMIIVKYEVETGPNAGRKTTNNFVISPENANALAFFFRHMRAMGLGSDYFATNPPLRKVAADLVGKRCRIEVGRRTWNGEEREDVKKILPPVAGSAPAAPSPMTQPYTTPQPVHAAQADPSAPEVPF